MMRKELTADPWDWFSMKNDIFREGDILIIHERVVVREHPDLPVRQEVGKVLAEPGDRLSGTKSRRQRRCH